MRHVLWHVPRKVLRNVLRPPLLDPLPRPQTSRSSLSTTSSPDGELVEVEEASSKTTVTCSNPENCLTIFQTCAAPLCSDCKEGSASASSAQFYSGKSLPFTPPLAEFQSNLPDFESKLMGADVETFGGICNEAVDQVLGTFDALASDSSDATRQAKRGELLRHVLRHLEMLHRDHLRHLETLAWDHMREGLAKLRLGDPWLLEDMESVVRDADIFFVKMSVKMVCKGASWTSNFERSRLVTKMRAPVKGRLLAARLQGAFVPGMLRRPVATSMHYSASHPFRFLEAIQGSLSYKEDMEWAPDFGIS